MSRHLVTRAPCPTLVLPYKSLGIVEHSRGDFSPDQVASPRVLSPRDSSGSGGVRADEEAADALSQAHLQPHPSAPAETGMPPWNETA